MDKYLQKYIALNNINDIKGFVEQAICVNGDVLCKRGNYVVDGSSILGLLSINVADGFMCEYPADAENFEAYISQFEK